MARVTIVRAASVYVCVFPNYVHTLSGKSGNSLNRRLFRFTKKHNNRACWDAEVKRGASRNHKITCTKCWIHGVGRNAIETVFPRE